MDAQTNYANKANRIPGGAVLGGAVAGYPEQEISAKRMAEAMTACGKGDSSDIARQPEFGFDGALNHIKEGRCVARRGWNGRGIFVYLNRGAVHFREEQAIPPLIDGIKRGLFEQWLGGISTRTPNIDIHSASGNTTHGWAPSQTDLLAEDWYIA